MRGNALLADQINWVLEHRQCFRQAACTLAPWDDWHRRCLYDPRVLTVIVETLRVVGESVADFWRSSASTDSGSIREARFKLLRPRPKNAPRSFPTRVVGAAWNRLRIHPARKLVVPLRAELKVQGTTLVIPAGE